MDPRRPPRDNFYLYANGGFIAHTKLPADRAAIGVFSVLSDRSFPQKTASIIEDAAKAKAAGPQQKSRRAKDRRPLSLLHGRERH